MGHLPILLEPDVCRVILKTLDEAYLQARIAKDTEQAVVLFKASTQLITAYHAATGEVLT